MKKVIFSLLTMLLAISLFAQDNQSFQFDYNIQSEAFNDERKITVYLPPSFYKYPEEKFTVTYILDGNFLLLLTLPLKHLSTIATHINIFQQSL